MYENYARIRDSRGLKDSDVAKATGISAGTLSDWKRGRYKLKYEKLQKIAEYLGVSTDQLAGIQVPGQAKEYYVDEEAAETAQAILEDSDLHALFKASRQISRRDLKVLVNMAEQFKETNPDG